MDRHTLFVMQASLLFSLGILVLFAFRSVRKNEAATSAYWFASGFILGGIGLFLQSQRGYTHPFFSIILGNGFFMLLGCFVNRSIAEATRQRSHFYYLLALSAATLVNYAYFTFWQPNVLMRTLEAVPVLTVMYASIMVLLLRAKDVVIQPALRAMAAVLLIHTLMSIIRIIYAWTHRQADSWFSWTGIFSIIGTALCFLWMDNLWLRHDLETRAMTDPLTGLLNRRALDMLATRELTRLTRMQAPCSALMLDVDRFKDINDRLGHAAGDASLCAVAEALKDTLRTSDMATRIGGDEFFILLPEADEESAQFIVTRLRKSISAIRLTAHSGENFGISVSIGRVTRSGPDLSIADLLHQSDLALYDEKQRSRFDAHSPNATTPQRTAGKSGAHVHPSSA